MMFWAILGCLLLPSSLAMPKVPTSVGLDENYMHSNELKKGIYTVKWTPREHDIVIQLEVATLSWVGFGFSPNGEMTGADIVMVWIDKNNNVHFTDRYGVGDTRPLIDESQDYNYIAASQNGTHTVVKFSRKWDTCDDRDLKIGDDTIQVIWAIGRDIMLTQEDITTYHALRGHRNIYLKQPSSYQPPKGRNMKKWELFSGGVKLPDKHHTLYWCNLIRRPDIFEKHHIVAYEPVIDPNNIKHVHHMVFYECHLNGRSTSYLQKFLNSGGSQCYSPNMPRSWMSCSNPIIAWAVGSEGEVYPMEVGFPLGENYGGADYFMLEIHYDNPTMKTGIIDNSGLSIYYTSDLRKYDAGTMWQGLSVIPTHIIPPNVPWDTFGYCTKECTEKGIPTEGINVFSVVHHQHLLGRAMNSVLIRKNKRDIKEISRDDNYDFNYQQSRYFKEPIVIYPGDEIQVTCTTNSSGKMVPTFGGLGTKSEMCLAYLNYYPKIPLSQCTSSRPPRDIIEALQIDMPKRTLEKLEFTMDVFGIGGGSQQNINERQEDEMLDIMRNAQELGGDRTVSTEFGLIFKNFVIKGDGTSLYDVFTNKSLWSDVNLERYRRFMRSGNIQSECLTNKGDILVEKKKKIQIPRFPELKSDSNCNDDGGFPSFPGFNPFSGFGGIFNPPPPVQGPGNPSFAPRPPPPNFGNYPNNLSPLEILTIVVNRILQQIY